jgi:hypothetical protein
MTANYQYQYNGFLISYFEGRYHLTIRNVKNGKHKKYTRTELRSIMAIIDNIRDFGTLPPSNPMMNKGSFWKDQLK